MREKARQAAAMKWQMIVLVAQLVLGGGLVVHSARKAAHYWLAYTDKDHAERLRGRSANRRRARCARSQAGSP